MKEENENWIQSFLTKNSWALLGLLVVVGIFYANTVGKIEALESDVDDLKKTQLLITNNQTQILLIQQTQQNIQSDLNEIKAELEQVKQLVQ